MTFPFSNQESQNYFERDHLHGLGTAYLVANSQFKLDFVPPSLHKDDVLLQVKVAELISSMTLGQQNKFYRSDVPAEQGESATSIISW